MINFVDKSFGRLGNRLFQSAYIYAQFREGNIPDIYLQDCKYFDKYKNEIREMFKQEGKPLDYVSIHVRRGLNPSNPNEPAYSENPFYVNLSETDYYKKAMAEFPESNFMVFSDDIPWCRQQTIFKGNRFEFSEDFNEEIDFNRMSRCKHNIIANSSFSLWCAILNSNPNRKAIAPIENKYYSDGVVRTKYPNDFIQIDFEKHGEFTKQGIN